MEEHLAKTVDHIRSDIETVLPRGLSQHDLERIAGPAQSEYDSAAQTKVLAKPLWDFMDRGGGNPWRPILPMLILAALGTEPSHRRYGLDVAINAGNTAYFLPMVVLRDHPHLTDEQRLELFRILTRLYVRVHLGQGQDIHWSKSLTPERLQLWMNDDVEEKILPTLRLEDRLRGGGRRGGRQRDRAGGQGHETGLP